MIKHRSFLQTLLLGFMSFSLMIACQAQPNIDTDSAPETATSSGLKVALVLTGSHEDKSWSQGGYEGLIQIEKEYNAEVEFIEYVSDEEAEDVMRQYAKQDYDLIIAHGGSFIEASEIVASEFPRTKFAVVTTYSGNNKNLGAVAFRSGEVGYLTGALAALTTTSNKVGYIVGNDYPVYQEEETLFRRGVTETNDTVEIFTEFLGTWTDGKVAIAVVQDLLDQGVDVIAINADEAGVAAIEVLTEHPEVKIIGWTSDQYELAPDQILTSVLQDIPALVLNSATLVQQGRWEGKLYKFGLQEKIYDFAPFRDSVPSKIEDQFNQLKAKVISGDIDISP